jgi:hypothetical protein
MEFIINRPLYVLVCALITLYLAEWFGASLRARRPNAAEGQRESFNLIVTASLTLLALIIGFSFSMATSRYDQRKNLEEEEANAIGTELTRTDLLPAADAARLRELLLKYLDKRILFYETRGQLQIHRVDVATDRLESDLWSAVRAPALAQPTPVTALVVAGMNDVLNSQGYTQAAWWNRIPTAAWVLMAAISISCNFLIGYGMDRADTRNLLLFVLPLVFSISFFLIADIDSPRWGVIRVYPQNMLSLKESLNAH